MALPCSLKATNKPFGFPQVSASVMVGAVVSAFTAKVAAPLVALPNALATWTRNEALLSLSFTGEKVNVLEAAPGMLVKTPAPALRCHWNDHGGAPVTITLKAAL